MSRLACLLFAGAVMVVVACGTRVSIGELAESNPAAEPESGAVGSSERDGASGAADSGTSPSDASVLDGDASDAGWTSCGGKKCGDSCVLCAPTAIGCFEAAVLKQCSSSGTCETAPVNCSGDGGN